MEYFYISVINGKRYSIVSGPYKSREEAESMVNVASNIAYKYDPKSWFYAWGTCMSPVEQTPVLNRFLEKYHPDELALIKV